MCTNGKTALLGLIIRDVLLQLFHEKVHLRNKGGIDMRKIRIVAVAIGMLGILLAFAMATAAIQSGPQQQQTQQDELDRSAIGQAGLEEMQKKFPERAVDIKQAINGDISYEELKAVGFYPPERRLEAIIHIKQQGGYGAFEFVRFWVDWNNNGVFSDDEYVGLENVYMTNPGNVPLPLEYAVYTDVVPPPGVTGVRKARANLTWSDPFNPYWGNSIVTNIRFDPIS